MWWRDDPVSKRLRMIFDIHLPRGQKPGNYHPRTLKICTDDRLPRRCGTWRSQIGFEAALNLCNSLH
jgi:hypothetical protein